MALRRFWIDIPCVSGQEIVISGDLFHHIRDVCRFSTGDQFELLPGDGLAHLAEISKLNKRDLLVRLLESRALGEVPRPWIHLALSIPKFSKVDFIVEKCVELGVYQLSLFQSDHSYPKSLTEVSQGRLARWNKIGKAAAQQSGRGALMKITEPTTLTDTLENFRLRPGVVGLFPYEGEATLGWQAAMQAARKSSPEEVVVFVGSEGGFSRREVELFQQFGLQPMTMGQQILRVETACVALVSVIKYVFEPVPL